MFYLLFKPLPGKSFTVHINVVSSENITVRITLSNMYKEFKSTSTWIQFPVLSNAVPGSVEEATMKEVSGLGEDAFSLEFQQIIMILQYVVWNIWIQRLIKFR